MLLTIRPQVVSLPDVMSYAFLMCLEGARHLPYFGHPKMSTYGTYMSYYSLYSKLPEAHHSTHAVQLHKIVKV